MEICFQYSAGVLLLFRAMSKFCANQAQVSFAGETYVLFIKYIGKHWECSFPEQYLIFFLNAKDIDSFLTGYYSVNSPLRTVILL